MYDVPAPLPMRPTKILGQFRAYLRTNGKAYRTEKSYVYWVRRLILFHDCTHPNQMAEDHLEAFLNAQVLMAKNSYSTQRIAAAAFKCFFTQFLDRCFRKLRYSRSDKTQRKQQALTQAEACELIKYLHPDIHLLIRLLLGTGLRIKEGAELRIEDIDFARREIFVRDGKGGKSRYLPLPQDCQLDLLNQRDLVLCQHTQDLALGYGRVYLPNSIARYSKQENQQFKHQYLFPLPRLSFEPNLKQLCRHHITDRYVLKRLKQAAAQTSILKNISCHTLRHTHASFLLSQGFNIREIQELLGHADIKTTQKYLHTLSLSIASIISPADNIKPSKS